MLVNVTGDRELTFTIPGNHRDRTGNPVSYKRTIRGAWRKDAVEYKLWQSYVRQQFAQAYSKAGVPISFVEEKNRICEKAVFIGENQPIALKDMCARMDLLITWSDKAHGDPDNIFKGIADSLFSNDKNLDGSFSSAMSAEHKGLVVVVIKFFYGKESDN